MTLYILALFLVSFAITACLTKLLHTRLVAKAIMDIPNERSMHSTPVPRGGGLALMAVIMTGLLYYMPNPYILSSIALLMIVSWIDDKKGLSSALRLGAHLLAAFIGSFALGEHAVIFHNFLPFWLDRILLIVGWAWFMNLYNFMDGIDGITATQTITCALGIGLFTYMLHLPLESGVELSVIIIGACTAFLFFNWHPAKLFMGDVGSIPLGFLIGFLLLKLALSGYVLSALILPLYYLLDSGITITRRALRGEKVWEPHKEHFYQRATAAIGHPAPVIFSVLIANLCLIAAAGVAVSEPLISSFIAAIVVSALFLRLSFASRNKS